jgi:hypothetical protein
VTVSASLLELPTPDVVFASITEVTEDGTAEAGVNVSREIGPECSFDAAVMAASVDGAREESVVGSATTRVDSDRCCAAVDDLTIAARRAR